MARYVVVGVAGAGKSTVSHQISQRMGIPHVELDALFWLENWTKTPPEVFEADVRQAAAAPSWVIDGNYGDAVRAITWGAADTIIWLDLSRRAVMRQLIVRTVGRKIGGTELWNGNKEKPVRDLLSRDRSRSILLWAWHTYQPTRSEYTQAMLDPRYAGGKLVRLSTHNQVKRYLRDL